MRTGQRPGLTCHSLMLWPRTTVKRNVPLSQREKNERVPKYLKALTSELPMPEMSPRRPPIACSTLRACEWDATNTRTSARSVGQGNTKQRIDEFESMQWTFSL